MVARGAISERMTQSLVGESENRGGDASDVIDGEKCIISIMRGLGGQAMQTVFTTITIFASLTD